MSFTFSLNNFFACIALAALPCLHAAELQLFSAERNWQIQRIGNPTISPDGKRVLAPISRYVLAEDKTLTDLWLWHTDGKVARAFTRDAGNESAPSFSPDGQHVAFVAQRGEDKAPQLYVMPLDGGEAHRLTNIATGVQSPKWFKDGKRIAFVSRIFMDLPLAEQQKRMDERAASKMSGRVWDGGPVTAWDQYLDERQFHVFSVEVAGVSDALPAIVSLTGTSGLQLPRSAVQGTDTLYAISPDGKQLAFVADSNPAREAANSDVFTLALDNADSKPVNLTSENLAEDSMPLYSPDGKYLSFLQQRIKGFYADKNRLMLLARQSGTTVELYPDWDRSADAMQWAPDSQRLYAAIDDAGTTRVYELPIRGKPRKVTGEASFSGLSLANNGALVGLRQRFDEPPTLVSISTRNGAATKLSSTNDALLSKTALGTSESVTYKGANGADIQMWVNYPPGFDPAKKYPLFMLIHGGPHSAITNSMTFRWNAQVFGSWGYVTAWPNFHGSSGFGQAFTDSINPEWAEQPYQDVIKAADYFANQSWIDKDRMAAGGGSYGGYLISIILGREHPFRTLIAHAAVYNLYTQYAADFATQIPRFGGFWEQGNDAVMRRNSPHFGAANFKTPTLVIHGQTDQRVPVNHGLELYQTLLMKGVPSRYIYFPNENHWVLKPQNSVFWYSEVEKWLLEHNGPKRD